MAAQPVAERSLSDRLAPCFPYKTTIWEQPLATLWAGYGTVLQADVRNDEDGSEQRYVVKVVKPPPCSGVSHERKIRSYEVEQFFYRHLATRELITRCPMPDTPFVGETDGALTLMMSDLRRHYPVAMGRYGSMDYQHACAGLRWLANFHAHFWERVPDEGVWEEGSFWHLSTRLEELEKIAPEWADLKAAAWDVDAALRPVGGRFRTLVHGDFKSMNLLWRVPPGGGATDTAAAGGMDTGGGTARAALEVAHAPLSGGASKAAAAGGADTGGGGAGTVGGAGGADTAAGVAAAAAAAWGAPDAGGGEDWPACAAVDYQYIGGGYGVRDVAYFMTSAVQADVLAAHEGDLLRFYHTTLTRQLTRQQAAEYSFEVAWAHFECALLDFVRFQAGRGWWGATEWATTRARQILAARFGRHSGEHTGRHTGS